MNIRDVVYDQVTSVATQQGKHLPPVTDQMRLLESGLDSLCFAILIASLDDILNISPFDADEVTIPVTVGDLIAVYENAAVHVA